MNIILIGSRALPKDVISRDLTQSDFDLIMSNSDCSFFQDLFPTSNIKSRASEKHPGKYSLIISSDKTNFDLVELDGTDNPSNQILFQMLEKNSRKYFNEKTIRIGNEEIPVYTPKLEILYLIKKSHLKCPVHFHKNYSDFQKMALKINTSNLELFMNDPLVMNLYSARYDEAKTRFESRQKRISFDVPNEKFFKKSESFRLFDHDNLHVLIAKNGVPVYTKCKRDPNKALINNDMFFDLSFEDQVRMVQEEATVIGIERFFLDTDNKEKISDKLTTVNGYDIYNKGLYKFICDLCKGDFQDHVLTHSMTLALQSYNIDWKAALKLAIQSERLLEQC